MDVHSNNGQVALPLFSLWFTSIKTTLWNTTKEESFIIGGGVHGREEGKGRRGREREERRGRDEDEEDEGEIIKRVIFVLLLFQIIMKAPLLPRWRTPVTLTVEEPRKFCVLFHLFHCTHSWFYNIKWF